MDRRENDKQWRVNREISLGDLVAIAVAVVSVVMAYMSLDARVTVVEIMSRNNATQISNTISEIKDELRRLNDRIEKVVDRHYRNEGLK